MNVSADDMGLTGLSTETLFTHSSKIPTYSSFQNDASSKLFVYTFPHE